MNISGLLAAILLTTAATAAPSLRLERTIPLPQVEGRIDHLALDAGNHRLFVAALGNNSVETVDLDAGTVSQPLRGLSEPQGICYLAETGQLYVANGGDGTVRVYHGKPLTPAGVIKLDDDADNVRFDPRNRVLYVGHGSGALAAIDPVLSKVVGDIALSGHPESFQLETATGRAFVNVPGSHEIAVVDLKAHAVTTAWPIGVAAGNFPMAIDEVGRRLFVGCRLPARLLVFDLDSGQTVARVDLHGDCDDLFFDIGGKRLFAACGEGYIDIFTATGGASALQRESIPTAPRARTCLLADGHLYLAVPRRGDDPAEIRDYVLTAK